MEFKPDIKLLEFIYYMNPPYWNFPLQIVISKMFSQYKEVYCMEIYKVQIPKSH